MMDRDICFASVCPLKLALSNQDADLEVSVEPNAILMSLHNLT